MNLGMNPSSAATQFEAWTREESTFRSAATHADRERSRFENQLRSLRQEQKQLSNETRESSDTLGHFHRERGLLQKENERFVQLVQEDRIKLEELAHESDELVAREMSEKSGFCTEMEAMNDDLTTLLMQQEDQRLKKVLSSTTVTAFCTSIGLSASEELTSALDAWKDAHKEMENVNQKHQYIKKKIEAARVKVLQEQTPGSTILNEGGLFDIERGWLEQSNETTDLHGSLAGHAQIFYDAHQFSQEDLPVA